MIADIGPLTRAAIEAGQLPTELPAETYAKIADILAASVITDAAKKTKARR